MIAMHICTSRSHVVGGMSDNDGWCNILDVARQFFGDIVRGKIIMQYADRYPRLELSILQRHTPRVLVCFSRPVSGLLSTNKSLALPYRARAAMHWCETRTIACNRGYFTITGEPAISGICGDVRLLSMFTSFCLPSSCLDASSIS
jgi:hypothetical protein